MDRPPAPAGGSLDGMSRPLAPADGSPGGMGRPPTPADGSSGGIRHPPAPAEGPPGPVLASRRAPALTSPGLRRPPRGRARQYLRQYPGRSARQGDAGDQLEGRGGARRLLSGDRHRDLQAPRARRHLADGRPAGQQPTAPGGRPGRLQRRLQLVRGPQLRPGRRPRDHRGGPLPEGPAGAHRPLRARGTTPWRPSRASRS